MLLLFTYFPADLMTFANLAVYGSGADSLLVQHSLLVQRSIRAVFEAYSIYLNAGI